MVGNFLRHYLPILPFSHGVDSIEQSLAQWYLSAEQHVFEFILLNLIFVPLTLYFFRFPHVAMRPARSHYPLSFQRFDLVFGFLSLLCLLGTVLLKVTKPDPSLEIFFLFQPCHVLNLLAILMSFAPSKSKLGTYSFNIFLYLMSATVFAMAFPDMRGRHPLEIVHFWALHWWLVICPYYFECTSKYDLWTPHFISGFSLNASLHWSILYPVALLRGINLNYIMNPPDVQILVDFGIVYRWPMTFATYVLTSLDYLVFLGFSKYLAPLLRQK